ncbi:MAG: SLC13 family permease [Sphingomonas sp.]
MSPAAASAATLAICVAAAAAVVIRPWRLPEAVWALAGAALLVGGGLLPLADAATAVARGMDVYLFLAGMMLLSEMARREGLFDWLAGHAVDWAGGSSARLFTLVYAIGVVVTAFMSNDATAVVMTPAVIAATRKAEADPLPALFACALVANAASFVLPISNPANLVLYGGHLPPLGAWLAAFALPAVVAIGVTWGVLRLAMRRRLQAPCTAHVQSDRLGGAAGIVLVGLILTAVLLLVMSALGRSLGLPTCLAALGISVVLLGHGASRVLHVVRSVSWSILPLVAGLFVLVAALQHIGAVADLVGPLGRHAASQPRTTALASGVIVALASNLANNLPVGLIASTTLHAAPVARVITDDVLIGVDLGPNLAVSGSLATILWLAALRREGLDVSYRQFFAIGALVMPPALLLAIAARLAI